MANDFILYLRLIIALLGLTVFNSATRAQNWYTLQNDDAEVVGGFIIDCSTSSINWGTGNLIIPENLDGQTVLGIKNDDNGIFNGKGIDSLQLPNTLKLIGNYAFHSNFLKNINIPGNVTYIGNGAFGNNLLTNLSIPASVDTIGNYSFKSNYLTSLTIPEGVTYIGSFAFSGNNLKNAVISNSVKVIGSFAFYENALTSITLPDNVISIGENAFSFNSLASVTIPAGLTAIETGTFSFNALTSVVIPNHISSIGDGAFSYNSLTDVTIPGSVTSIGDYAFSNNVLVSLTIPGSMTSIGDYAFYENELTSLSILNGIKSIGDYAFSKNEIAALMMPSSVDSIGNYAFYQNSLTTLTISGDIVFIGDFAFSKNILESVTLPDIIYHMGIAAFNENAIVSVNDEISDGIFYARNGDGTEKNTAIVSYGGISDQVNFIPLRVTSIGNYAFFNSQLKSVRLPYGITYIGNSAFYNNTLPDLFIPGSVDTIEHSAFSNNLLQHLIFETISGIRYIGNAAFIYNRLTGITIPNSVTYVGDNAFYSNLLTSVAFQANSSVTYFGNNAFERNYSLTSISLPVPVYKEGFVFTEWKNSNDSTVAEITKFNLSYGATFAGTTHYEVSGNITIDQTFGLLLNLTGDFEGTTRANTDGSFGFSLNANRNITIVPTREGYTFTPESINVSNIQADLAGLDFTAIKNTFNVTFAASTNGSLTGETSQEIDYGGTTSEVTAIANAGFRLLEWRNSAQEIVSNNNPLVYTVTGNETITAVFTPVTSAENIDKAAILCYPNPTTNYITIESPDLIDEIEIFSTSGEKVYATGPIAKNRVTLSLAKFTPGIYILYLTGDNSVKLFKVVLE